MQKNTELPDGQDFQSGFWLRNGHVQTLWRKFSAAPAVVHTRQRIELQDGDFIDVDWHRPTSEPANNRTIILLLHGLCGCSRSGYILSLQQRLAQSGLTSAAMNFRGCSGEINRLARSYHSGVSEDLGEVIGELKACNPEASFALVGFSLGANVLLKWLGETGITDRINRAVAVSTPFDLSLCSNAMRSGLSSLYGRFFLRRLVANFKAKHSYFERQANPDQLAALRACGRLRGL